MHFYIKTLIQCFEYAECIAIDIFGVLGCNGSGSLDDVKKRNRFSSTKLLTRVTVADKLVLVNSF